jgi:hypothetical protein
VGSPVGFLRTALPVVSSQVSKCRRPSLAAGEFVLGYEVSSWYGVETPSQHARLPQQSLPLERRPGCGLEGAGRRSRDDHNMRL